MLEIVVDLLTEGEARWWLLGAAAVGLVGRADRQGVAPGRWVGWWARCWGAPGPRGDRPPAPGPRGAREERTDGAASPPGGVGGRGSGVGPNGSADPRPPIPDIR